LDVVGPASTPMLYLHREADLALLPHLAADLQLVDVIRVGGRRLLGHPHVPILRVTALGGDRIFDEVLSLGRRVGIPGPDIGMPPRSRPTRARLSSRMR